MKTAGGVDLRTLPMSNQTTIPFANGIASNLYDPRVVTPPDGYALLAYHKDRKQATLLFYRSDLFLAAQKFFARHDWFSLIGHIGSPKMILAT